MLKAAVIYFAIVFGVGFVLGPIRVLLVEPRVGTRTAELIEAPAMLVAMALAGRWVGHRFVPTGQPSKGLGAGLIAAGLVLAADLVVGVVLRGMRPAEVFTRRDVVSGIVYYGLLVAFSVMPWLFARRAALRDRIAQRSDR